MELFPTSRRQSFFFLTHCFLRVFCSALMARTPSGSGRGRGRGRGHGRGGGRTRGQSSLTSSPSAAASSARGISRGRGRGRGRPRTSSSSLVMAASTHGRNHDRSPSLSPERGADPPVGFEFLVFILPGFEERQRLPRRFVQEFEEHPPMEMLLRE